MLLKVTHETTLTYSDLIAETIMELRVAPRQAEDQLRMSFTLALGPPTNVSAYFDWLGNQVHVFSVTPFHRNVQITATSIVETNRKDIQLAGLKDSWPLAGVEYTYYDYLQFGGPIADCAALRELVEQLKPAKGMRLGELALRMQQLIHDKFTYEKGVTSATTPITEILEHHRGVCQDFTHLMIAMARALGVPARYVSGLIHSGDDPLRGGAQTHAWCELYFPLAGWIGFDPTNNTLADERFISVAVGRDYRDVPPNRGVYRGKAAEKMEVSVTTEALAAVPFHLAGERMHTLRVPTYPDGRDLSLNQIRKLQEQQQQQQQEQQQQQQQQ